MAGVEYGSGLAMKCQRLGGVQVELPGRGGDDRHGKLFSGSGVRDKRGDYGYNCVLVSNVLFSWELLLNDKPMRR